MKHKRILESPMPTHDLDDYLSYRGNLLRFRRKRPIYEDMLYGFWDDWKYYGLLAVLVAVVALLLSPVYMPWLRTLNTEKPPVYVPVIEPPLQMTDVPVPREVIPLVPITRKDWNSRWTNDEPVDLPIPVITSLEPKRRPVKVRARSVRKAEPKVEECNLSLEECGWDRPPPDPTRGVQVWIIGR